MSALFVTARPRLVLLLGLLATAVGLSLVFARAAFAQGTGGPAGSDTGSMNAETIVVVGGAVTTLTQLIKFLRLPDDYGPYVVVLFSVLGVLLWGVSYEAQFSRSLIWPYFASSIAVMATAAGVFGFVRATQASAITRTSPPASGAGSHSVRKIGDPSEPTPRRGT